MKKIIILTLLFFITLQSCATITPGGAKVDYTKKGNAPANAEFLGNVEVTSSVLTVKEVIVRLRNQTHELGGDFLVIDEITGPYNELGGYWGKGRAYKRKE